MTEQSYLIIKDGVVENICIWDGNTETWLPPYNTIQIPQETTPCMVWALDDITGVFELKEELGSTSIGFTFDGLFTITNLQKPVAIITPRVITVALKDIFAVVA
jgi:hypothetical protein